MNPTTIMLIRLCFMVVLAIGGYQLARNHESEHGYVPWNLPRWAWSILWALGLLPGAILWVIATRTGKRPLAPTLATTQSPPVGGPFGAGAPDAGHYNGNPAFGAVPDSAPTQSVLPRHSGS